MRRQAVLEAGSRVEGTPHPSTKGSHSGGGAGVSSPKPISCPDSEQRSHTL